MDEKRDLLKQLSDQSDAIIKHSDSKNPEKTWMYRVTQGFWNELYQARETGRPIILCSPNVPQEMIYSLGAVPLPVDALPTRLASSKDAWRYIDISEQYVPTTVCSINKVLRRPRLYPRGNGILLSPLRLFQKHLPRNGRVPQQDLRRSLLCG